MTDNNLSANDNNEEVAEVVATPEVKETKTVAKKEKEVQKKPGLFKRLGKFFKETKSEVKKVAWPTKSQIINNTIVVCVMIAIIGTFIFLLDGGFTLALNFIIGLA